MMMIAPLRNVSHWPGTPASVITLTTSCRASTPVSAPKIVPRPPFSPMPPMTAAAMTWKIMSLPCAAPTEP